MNSPFPEVRRTGQHSGLSLTCRCNDFRHLYDFEQAKQVFHSEKETRFSRQSFLIYLEGYLEEGAFLSAGGVVSLGLYLIAKTGLFARLLLSVCISFSDFFFFLVE